MPAPMISIIITNKNAMKWLEKCLASLKNQSSQDFEVILVDNASADQSVSYVKNNFPFVKVIKNNKDKGFAGANNDGAACSKGKYLLLLNTDAYLEKNTIRKLITIIKQNPHYRFMQLDIRSYEKKKFKNIRPYMGMDFFGYPLPSKHIFYADGSGLVISKDLFDQLGGFDEKHYLYYEDIDLAWRARLIGEEVYFLHDIISYHHGGGTAPVTTQNQGNTHTTTLSRRYHSQKNNLRNLIKNYSLANLMWTLPISILLASGEGLLFLLKGNLAGFLFLHKAILWNVLNLKSTLKKRSQVQKTRKISDFEILKLCEKRLSKAESFFLHGIPSTKN